MKNEVLILLSTYNGEKYIAKQLDSIIAQTYTAWKILVRDDGSSDATVQIVHDYSHKDPRIILVEDTLGNQRVPKSFSVLMQYALKRNEDYIFFCDQDDVWLPNKLELQTALLQQMEATYGTDIPLLVHSDLCVVDKDLRVIHPSYIGFERLRRNPAAPLKTLLINNYVTGCTVGFNRALLKMATPVPENAFMHDWWCALCAAAAGHIGFVEKTTLLYRQHGGNSIGSSGYYGKLRELGDIKKTISKRKKNLRACFSQAQSLMSRIDDANANYDLIAKFVSLQKRKRLPRYFSAKNLHLQPAGTLKRLAFWVFLGLV